MVVCLPVRNDDCVKLLSSRRTQLLQAVYAQVCRGCCPVAYIVLLSILCGSHRYCGSSPIPCQGAMSVPGDNHETKNGIVLRLLWRLFVPQRNTSCSIDVGCRVWFVSGGCAASVLGAVKDLWL